MSRNDTIQNHDDLLKQYRDISLLAGADPAEDAFPSIKEERLAKRKHRYRRLGNYARRLTRLVGMEGYEQAVLLVTDSDGSVLEAFHAADFAPPEGHGCERGAVWQSSVLGPNAITIGLNERISFVTVGEENFNRKLQQYAIYFAPVQVMSDGAKRASWVEAGVACVVPVEQAHPMYLTFVRTVAHDLMLNLHFYQTAYWFYQRVGQAAVTIGREFTGDDIVITHIDPKIFEIFQIAEKDVAFKPLVELIDPLPANAEFWTVLKEMRDVVQTSMVLTVNGRDIPCIISTWSFNQPGLDVLATDIVVTTDKLSTAQIASRIGNSARMTFDDIVTESAALKETIHKAKLLANTNSNIMLLGESGVGKDVFAQAIHNASDRRNKPFIVVNCAAIPRDLIASELFGYDSGAFTGAKRQGNLGKFELANEGTIFLDEIGELPADLQATLLRIVEQKQFQRIGSNKVINVDVKIISATNADIPKMIEDRSFRMDLFYRLSTMQLDIPPLRARDKDAVVLAEHFIHRISERIGRTYMTKLSPESKKLLLSLNWPGNVRELQNLMERVVQLYPETVILPHHILDNLGGITSQRTLPESSTVPVISSEPVSYSALADEEKKLLKKHTQPTLEEILAALKACNGNRTQAAEYLGVSRKTFYRYLERYGQGD